MIDEGTTQPSVDTLDGSTLARDKIGRDAGGAAAMNSPSVEALSEFIVEAGHFKTETGLASSGTLGFVTKPSTSLFHGRHLKSGAYEGPE